MTNQMAHRNPQPIATLVDVADRESEAIGPLRGCGRDLPVAPAPKESLTALTRTRSWVAVEDLRMSVVEPTP